MAKQSPPEPQVTVYLRPHVKRRDFVDAETGLVVTHEPRTVPVSLVGWRTRSEVNAIAIEPVEPAPDQPAEPPAEVK